MKKIGKSIFQLTPIEQQTMAYALNELLRVWENCAEKTKEPELLQSVIHAQRMLEVIRRK